MKHPIRTPEAFPPLESQAYLDAARGSWRHKPRKRQMHGDAVLTRIWRALCALGLPIAVIVALWGFTVFATETTREVFSACPTEAC